MPDCYHNFADLAANERLGIDYRIRVKDRGTPVIILTPHGGWIEPGTSEIAEAIAGSDLSFYVLEALKNRPHGDLHITSHRFDEPKAVQVVGSARTAIAIHGRRNEESEAVWLGGRATTLCDAIGASLRDVGFDAEPNMRLPGSDRANICNRTLTGEGAQLELPRLPRHRLTSEAALLHGFCEAVHETRLCVCPLPERNTALSSASNRIERPIWRRAKLSACKS
jgi:phage replication-related protein YjqB (UPF0714/DUF867 family)